MASRRRQCVPGRLGPGAPRPAERLGRERPGRNLVLRSRGCSAARRRFHRVGPRVVDAQPARALPRRDGPRALRAPPGGRAVGLEWAAQQNGHPAIPLSAGAPPAGGRDGAVAKNSCLAGFRGIELVRPRAAQGDARAPVERAGLRGAAGRVGPPPRAETTVSCPTGRPRGGAIAAGRRRRRVHRTATQRVGRCSLRGRGLGRHRTC